MAQRTPATGFADACIEKAAAKSASAGKKLCALCALCGYILRVLRAFVVNIFIKNVIFLLNILGQFGIIQTAIEMAVQRRTARLSISRYTPKKFKVKGNCEL